MNNTRTNARTHSDSFNPGRDFRASDRQARFAPPTGNRNRSSLARLEALEDELLDAFMDNHPNRDRALDRLMADVRRGGLADAAPAPLPSVADRVRRIEQLLVAAVIDGHPNRDAALDRLLDDVDTDRERAAFDAGCDNDWDGLG